MKSHKEIRLLAAILFFVASGIILFSTIFVKGIPFVDVVFILLLSGAIAYLGVALLVFKEKFRLLNVVALGVILLVIAIPTFVEIGAFIPKITTIFVPEFYVELAGTLVFLAILVLVFINALKKFNLLLTYLILSLGYVALLITAIILTAVAIPALGVLAAIADVALLAGLGVALLYYKDVDANGAKEKACICTRRELKKVELAKKNLELLKNLADLQKEGTITQKEFDAKKATLL